MSTFELRWRDFIFGLFVISCLGACAPHYYQIPDTTYTLSGRNYTYAIYNQEHRLMTHPLKDLLVQLESRRIKCRLRNLEGTDTEIDEKKARPISDIYIVSHGWNYTAVEAVSRYHSYMEIANEFMELNDSLPLPKI